MASGRAQSWQKWAILLIKPQSFYGLGDSGALYFGSCVMLEDQVLPFWNLPSGFWVTVYWGVETTCSQTWHEHPLPHGPL